MSSRKGFLQQSSLGLFSFFLSQTTFPQLVQNEFKGVVLNDDEGETYQYPDRITGAATRTLKIKVSRIQGNVSMSFLTERFMPGDAIQVHKHTNEDELIYIHSGFGIFTLDEKEYAVSTGSVALVPRGIWHGLKNTGSEYIEMRFAYTPAGLENYFREIGTPIGQPFKKITTEQRTAIGLKYGLIRKTVKVNQK